MLYNSYCCIIMRRANQTGMHVRTCIHMEITSGLHCSAVFPVCAAPLSYCPLLAPATPRQGGGTRPGGCSREPAYVPAATALPYPHTAGMHRSMHTSLRTAVFLLCAAPLPPRRCSWARGRSQTWRPRRGTRTLKTLRQNQPKLGK